MGIVRIEIVCQYVSSMGMKRFMLSITEEMEKALEKERKRRMLGTIPEAARVILGEYLAKNLE